MITVLGLLPRLKLVLGVIPRLKLLNFVQIFVSTAVSAVIVTIKRSNCNDLLVARDLMDPHAEGAKVM